MLSTKIVATIGPASASLATLCSLLQAGINVTRLNFSHGTHPEHERLIKLIRAASAKTNLDAAILLDTKGPEIRTGSLLDKQAITLKKDSLVRLTEHSVPGTADVISISVKGTKKIAQIGTPILLDEGAIELKVNDIGEDELLCQVTYGGVLGEHKSVNIPGAEQILPSLAKQDLDDITFGIQAKIDFIAASFVRSKDDVLAIKNFLTEQAAADIKVIAKIESRLGVANLQDILKVADGVMVARGDLGVEIPFAEVPMVQKQIITSARAAGKCVITATEMLDSMQHHVRPSRAEASDVVNAVLDGTDAVMLSGETATGNYPVEATKAMGALVYQGEQALLKNQTAAVTDHSLATELGKAAQALAENVQAKALLLVDPTARTLQNLTTERPLVPLIAITANPALKRQAYLVFGLFTCLVTSEEPDWLNQGLTAAENSGLLKSNDLVVTVNFNTLALKVRII
ncbi:MAG: pyruvate kinase [Bacillota bacterium]